VKRFVFLLLGSCLTAFSLQAEDFIGSRSPDGRFGLLLQPNNSPSKFDISVIEISSRKPLLRIEPYDESEIEFGRVFFDSARLLWSPDSKRGVYYIGSRRGGETTVYSLSGSQFIEMPLPKWHDIVPRLKPNERGTKFLSDDVSPVRWLNSSTLVLQEQYDRAFNKLDKNGDVLEQGLTAEAIATVTVRFDAKNKASLQSVKLMSEQEEEFLTSASDKQEKGDNDGAIADFNRAIKVDPTNAHAYEGRGGAKQAKGDYNGAIADYSRAIELAPINAYVAFVGRSDAKQAKGDYDGAIADYDRAIDLAPIKAEAYNGRGNAKQIKSDNDGAIADFSRAIDLEPDASYYYNRGAAYFVKRDWASALADFRRSCELNREDQDSPPCIWLIRARQGEKEAANQELATKMEQHLNNAPDDWASKITNFLLNKINEADFLAAAVSADAEKKRDQQCDAWFYAGMKRLLDGDNPAAIDYFQKALATEAQTEEEYGFAAAELKALGKTGGN
jgi:tetratricopeptide (TPR) repeat protein